jgi:hypothetical protein
MKLHPDVAGVPGTFEFFRSLGPYEPLCVFWFTAYCILRRQERIDSKIGILENAPLRGRFGNWLHVE